MPITLTWSEIAIRVLCAVVVGGLMGLNRSEHGRAAGLRTSILVCLAACIAMVQVNLLLPLAGRAPNSFVMNDLMRLPLGILSGMGFLGGGAILRRDNLVTGVTTAATMWFLTVVGLCFGGGQMGIGLTGSVVGLVVLTGFKLIEDRMQQDHQGKLVVVTEVSGPDENQIREILLNDKFQISSSGFAATSGAVSTALTCELRWRARPDQTRIPPSIRRLGETAGVVRIAWTPQAR